MCQSGRRQFLTYFVLDSGEALSQAGAELSPRKSSLGGIYVRVGGFTFVPEGLDIENLIKSPMIYSASYFEFGGLGSLFGGRLSPP